MENLWQRYQDWLYYHEGLGLYHEEGWLGEFPMDDWIGGRTSEMSAVGLLLPISSI